MKNGYIIISSFYHVIDSKIRELAADTTIDMYSYNDISMDEIINDASYGSFFAENRTIVIKDIPFFSSTQSYEDEVKILCEYLKNIDSNIKFIMICSEFKKTKKQSTEILPYVEVIDLSLTDEKGIFEYLKKYVSDNNITIDDNILKILQTNYQNNLDMIINELDKLSLLHKKIDIDIINEYSFKYEEDKTFDFSNAIITKNYKEAFKLLDIMLNRGVEVPAIIGLLGNSFINMYLVKSAKMDNLTDEEVSDLLEYNNTKRVYAVNRNANLYTLDQIEEIIKNLSDLDFKIKTGYDPVNTLKAFLVSL